VSVHLKTNVLLHSGQKLVNQLKQARERKLLKKIGDWITEGKKGPQPKHLSPLECAEVLDSYVIFCLFSDEENQKVAIYLPDKGIYTQNETYIQYLISHIEPDFNEQKAKDVIYHVKNIAFGNGIREKTRDPNLIPVNNGVYDKKQDKLLSFSPDFVFTTKIDTNYVENAEHPEFGSWLFDDWLKEIACNDEEVIELLWQVINESLNGNYTRKKSFFLTGTGNNGKGTYQELLMNLVGRDNVGMLKANEFEHRFSLEAIKDKSLVVGDDVPPNVYIKDLSNFKSIITGDPVSIEGKNKPIYHDVLTPTIIQSTNGMPKSLDKSNGLLRRIVIVPFNAEFKAGISENVDIKEVFLRDKQLLEYVLFKAIKMDFKTFTIPKQSVRALDEFKRDNDPLYEFKIEVMDEWLTDCIPKSLVYDVYVNFCEESGYKQLASRKFHKELSEHLGDEWESKKTYIREQEALRSIPFEPYLKKYGIDVDEPMLGGGKSKTVAAYVRS